MPELPGAMRERFVSEYGLNEYDAQTLTATKEMATFFEDVARRCGDAKAAANWVLGEVSAALNERQVDPRKLDLPDHFGNVSAEQLAGLIARVADGTINNKTAKDVFAALWAGEERERRRDHRSQRAEADFRLVGDREDSRRCACGQREVGRGVSSRQGKGV